MAVYVRLKFILPNKPVEVLLLDLLAGKVLFFFVSKYLQTFCQGLHLLWC